MINLRPVFFVVGALITILAGFMLIPALVDLQAGNDEWQIFSAAALFTGFCGLSIFITNKDRRVKTFTTKQIFIIITASWTTLALFSSLPFILSDIEISFTDAIFESVSGLTTTGSTILIGLDEMLPGILVWRALLQWIGGFGFIVMAMAILPLLSIGGMHVFRAEYSDHSDGIMPRSTQVFGTIGGLYAFITLICALCLWTAGMSGFDSICHAMTTIATSGFSTHDASISYFDSQVIELIMIFFMIISSIPFVLYIQFIRGRKMTLLKDTQVRFFLLILVSAVGAMTFWLSYFNGVDIDQAFRDASFNVVSIITTTGFSSSDYTTWGSFAVVVLLIFGVIGGCSGSTTGGIKIFRFQILISAVRAQINRLIQPHGVFLQMFNGRNVHEDISNSVMSFIILFGITFAVISVMLSTTGLDYMTSISAAASAIANLGPAVGSDIIGPGGNYSSLPDMAKWTLSFAMLLGRLEIFTVLIILSPFFWKS